MFEQSFKNIDATLRKDSGVSNELDYVEQTSWILFLKYLEDLEQDKANAAILSGEEYNRLIESEYQWSTWAAPKQSDGSFDYNALTGDDLIENDVQTVIFDNLSVLQPNNERAAEATELLNKLNALKRKHGINLLAIGHTPKLLAGKALEITDLQGSAQMGNLIDSAFVIGKTSKSDYRYLKQVKVREKEFRYDSENVLLMRISNEDNWLKFVPTKQVAEYELISIHNSNDSLAERDKEIYKQYLQGIPREQIESTFNISKSRFYEIIKAQKQSSPLEDVD